MLSFAEGRWLGGFPLQLASFETHLNEAESHERNYEWAKACQCYRRAAASTPSDSLKAGMIQETLAYSLFRAGMQADNSDEFRHLVGQARSEYRRARELYAAASGPSKTSRALRCDAYDCFLGFWLAASPSEKLALLLECWPKTTESLRGFEESREPWEFWKTFYGLSFAVQFAIDLCWDIEIRRKLLREMIEFGDRSVHFLSGSNPEELARAYARTSCALARLGGDFAETLEYATDYLKKAHEYLEKAKRLSEEATFLEMCPTMPPPEQGHEVGTDRVITILQNVLIFARKTGDRFLIGSTLDWLAYNTGWKSMSGDNQEEIAELSIKAMDYAREAREEYSRISFTSPKSGILWIEAPEAEHYCLLSEREMDLDKARELLDQAFQCSGILLKKAEHSGYPEIIWYAHHVVSKILLSLARMEVDSKRKTSVLEDSLSHRHQATSAMERVYTSSYFSIAVMKSYAADAHAELAQYMSTPVDKAQALQAAIQELQPSVDLFRKGLLLEEKTGLSSASLYGRFAQSLYQYGNLLVQLWETSKQSDVLNKASSFFQEAGEFSRKAGMIPRLAECYWRVARVNDLSNERLQASEGFLLASHNYSIASEDSPRLAEFYHHYASYMEAWSEIEKAQYFHAHQQHSAAETSYRKAAEKLNSSSRWTFLSPNYSALAQIEHVENLFAGSRETESVKPLEEAIRLVKSSSETLREELEKSQDPEWKEFLTKLIDASSAREASWRRVARKIMQPAWKEGSNQPAKGEIHDKNESINRTIDLLNPSLERPLGIERFDHASIESKLVPTRRFVKSGQNLEISIAIVNVGRYAAQLIRLDGAIPEGLALTEPPTDFEVESSWLKLKGKRLGPLQTEVVKLGLKPQNQGLFTFKPRIVYFDENRQLRTNEPSPEKVLASPLVEYLMESFALDHNRAGLSQDHAGWRTLMDMVKSLKISRSQVYGDQKSGNTFAKPLRKLVEAGLLEMRIFPGQRGRGGRVAKVRIRHENDEVRKFFEELYPLSSGLSPLLLKT